MVDNALLNCAHNEVEVNPNTNTRCSVISTVLHMYVSAILSLRCFDPEKYRVLYTCIYIVIH